MGKERECPQPFASVKEESHCLAKNGCLLDIYGMDLWMDECLNRWANGLMDEWVKGWEDRRKNGQMDGWISGCMDMRNGEVYERLICGNFTSIP